MPVRGRNRLVASKASGTKLFVDDLREVTKLTQTEHKTTSDVLRELVHESLVTRRLRAMGRDEEENHLRQLHQQAISTGVNPLEKEIKQLTEMVSQLVSRDSDAANQINQKAEAVQKLLTEVLGFTMSAEMKTHLLLQNFLLNRGLSEEAIQKLIAEHETKSRQQTEQIVTGILS
jgi:hypothetical protein